MFFLLLFPLRQDASPPVLSMNILKSSTSNFATSVEFSNALFSLTIMCLHGCCSFITVFIMKQMIRTGARLDKVGKTHSIIVFAQTTVIIEVKPCMEVTL